MAISNKQMVDTIVASGSPSMKTAFENVDTNDGEAVYTLLKTYEGLQNEFISTLMNRVVKTQFFNKVFDNPLKMLHNGMLGFGDSIQQIFVNMGERKGFNEHFESSGNSENDLIGKRVPQVDVDYITKNFAHKYKVSISELQLKQAFLSEGGLSRLATSLIESNTNGAYYDEYKDMLGLLSRSEVETKDGHTYGKGVIQQIVEDTTLNKSALVKLGSDWTPHALCETVRAYAGKMTFPSSYYNLAKVNTWSNKQDLVFFTTPETVAKIDINVIAQAFNVSSAEVTIRTIEVHELPTTTEGKVLGVIADKDLVQAWDIINTAKTFENGDALYTNYFLHKQGIMALCKFAQCVVITDGVK